MSQDGIGAPIAVPEHCVDSGATSSTSALGKSVVSLIPCGKEVVECQGCGSEFRDLFWCACGAQIWAHVQNRTLTAKANVAGAATIRMVHCLLPRSTMKKPMASLSSDARIRALTIRCRSCGLITTFGMGGLL